jgi:AAA+ ATPase superfamily predicted ATPase
MIQKFINRENELDFLENCYESARPEFIIIYGRRRVGKTELIQKSLKNKHGVYFLASKDTTY